MSARRSALLRRLGLWTITAHRVQLERRHRRPVLNARTNKRVYVGDSADLTWSSPDRIRAKELDRFRLRPSRRGQEVARWQEAVDAARLRAMRAGLDEPPPRPAGATARALVTRILGRSDAAARGDVDAGSDARPEARSDAELHRLSHVLLEARVDSGRTAIMRALDIDGQRRGISIGAPPREPLDQRPAPADEPSAVTTTTGVLDAFDTEDRVVMVTFAEDGDVHHVEFDYNQVQPAPSEVPLVLGEPVTWRIERRADGNLHQLLREPEILSVPPTMN